MSPIRSAQELVDAFQAAQAAKTDSEKEIAAARLVKAQRDHYRKLGLEPEGNLFSRVIIPLLLVIVVLVTLALVVKFSYDASHTASKARDTATRTQSLTRIIHVIQAQKAITEHENCERANKTRRVNIGNLRSDVHTLKTTLGLWEAAIAASGVGEAPPPVLAAFTRYLAGLRHGITHKQKSIRGTIAAQRAVAIEKGSPVVDCELVAPLHGPPSRPTPVVP